MFGRNINKYFRQKFGTIYNIRSNFEQTMITLIWVAILLVVVVQYLWNSFSKFSSYGVNTIKPVPIFGNSYSVLSKKAHIAQNFNEVYKAFPEDRFVGRYDMGRAVVILRELDLIKKASVKDFEHFLDHSTMVDATVEPLFGRNLFSLRGQEWKDMRSTLSPAFTSSKIRGMVPFMEEVNTSMINVLKKKIQASGDGQIEVDCKDLTTRYANDVIASCAFGVKVDSHVDEENEFYQKGRSTANLGFRRVLVFMGYATFPKLMKKFNVRLFSETTTNFFKSLVLSTMKERDIHKIIRPDMIHLLMEAKKGKLTYEDSHTETMDTGFSTVEESEIGKKTVNRVWSDTDLVAQATLFFIAGFETISSTMSFILHELAVNPDVQEKLVKEIRENELKSDGKFDYNSIQNLKYMDMVVSEVLRMWPPAVGLDRLCIKDYNLGKANNKTNKDYIIRKGESLVIPVWSLHHDPNYFPNPSKFDPERFSDENKSKIAPFTYLPFGSGPRNCIGSRFALCEVKVMLYQLLQNFEITVCEKTAVPAKLATNTFNIRIDGGHWVGMKLRK